MEEDTKREDGWIIYLKAHPKKAKKLIKEAEWRSIKEIEEIYSAVITAYSETKELRNNLITKLVELAKSPQVKNELGGWSKAMEKASHDGEKEWNRLSNESHHEYGLYYAVYKREVETIKASYKEIELMLLS